MAISVSPELLALADRVPLAVDWEVAVRAPLAFSCRLIQACWLHPGFRRRGWTPCLATSLNLSASSMR